jgi:Ca2+-binding RTX toxin-like protein
MLAVPELNITYDGVEQFEITDRGGNDTYTFSTKKKRTALHDEDGTDTLDFSGALARLSLRLVYSEGTSQWIHAGNNRLALYGIFENVIGTPFADAVSGNDANNVITTGAGNDTVYGRAGNDEIDTGDGDDTLAGNRHDDVLWAGTGNDAVNGGGGRDTVEGGDGDDVLYGFKGHDLIRGGAGNDDLTGGDGDDLLLGGIDGDALFGGLGRDVLIGGEGLDDLAGASGEDLLVGSHTMHDSDDAALKAILAEWRSDRPIDDRIDRLLNGGGYNGDTTLSDSVLDDAMADLLEGGWAMDWFITFADDTFADGEPKSEDRVTNRS